MEREREEKKAVRDREIRESRLGAGIENERD